MQALRGTISGAAAACVAVTAALVIASAPAASSRQDGRLLVTSAAARRYAGVVERASVAWPRREAASGNITAKGALLTIRPTSLATASSGRMRVVIETSNPTLARESVRALGGRVERSAVGLVQALVTPRAAAALAGKAGVDRVRPPYAQIQTAVSGEQVGVALAAQWHEKGFTGKGVKVAVIDGGFKGLADRQASGDLPANVVTQDFCGGQLLGAEDHGTAVAEIVHEIAPDAQLYLACVGTEVDLAAAEAWAKSQGVTVINHSAGWEGPYRDDGGGPVSAVVADARASGILWVNSAGNEAMTHWSGSYTPNGSWQMWSPNGDMGNSFIWPNGMEICGFLKWDEWPSGISDFDLGLFLSGSNSLLAISEGDQGSGQPPFEAMCWQQTSGRDLVVFWAIRGYRVATSPRLDLVSWSLPLQYSVASGSIASPASSPAALAVGALCWQSRALEPYSSQGPTIDGRTKPDIVGHDSVSGATYGGFSSCPSAFAGTSASSPEVAGAAALVRQAYPNLTPDQLKAYLMRATRDLGDAGLDNVYGAGELQLPKPPDIVAPTISALASKGGKGRPIALRSRVSDDSGEVSVVEEIKLGRRVVAHLKPVWFSAAVRSKTVAVAWKTPKTGSGSYQHCVRAVDRAGNSSGASCARVVLK
jgi:subtilisin family serine protease